MMSPLETPNQLPPAINAGPLPDPFAWPDGRRVQAHDEWPERGRAWARLIADFEYGGLPPAPTKIEVESRCHAVMRRWPDQPNFLSYGVRCHGGATHIYVSAQILCPKGDGPFPAIVCGDGCFGYMTDSIRRKIVDAGLALVTFNRTELAEDLVYAGCPDKFKRSGGLYDVYPESGFGAVAAWAWGYHRVVDMLQELPFIDSSKIAISGHSRGAKTVLLAGATDERIALVHDNASCAGGAAPYRYVGHGGESLSIVNNLYSWFGGPIREMQGAESDLPFDQHCLLAAIAPRALLITYGLDDRWANPEGMVISAQAAREVYHYLGAAHQIAYHLRPGGHFYAEEDWDRLLEFIAWRWQGVEPTSQFNKHPYAQLPRGYEWSAPTT